MKCQDTMYPMVSVTAVCIICARELWCRHRENLLGKKNRPLRKTNQTFTVVQLRLLYKFGPSLFALLITNRRNNLLSRVSRTDFSGGAISLYFLLFSKKAESAAALERWKWQSHNNIPSTPTAHNFLLSPLNYISLRNFFIAYTPTACQLVYI